MSGKVTVYVKKDNSQKGSILSRAARGIEDDQARELVNDAMNVQGRPDLFGLPSDLFGLGLESFFLVGEKS